MFNVTNENKAAAAKESGILTLSPGIHHGLYLSNVEKEETVNGTKVMTFTFSKDNTPVHKHTEWDIRPDDINAEQKASNMAARVVHIYMKALKFDVPVENHSSFDAFATKMVQYFNENKDSAVEVSVKVVASVYNGKPQGPKFPNYTSGFVSNDESKSPVSLSEKEKSDIAAYHAKIASGEIAKTEDVSASVSDKDEDLPF